MALSALAAFGCAFAGAPLSAYSRTELAVSGVVPAASAGHAAETVELPRRDPFAGSAPLARSTVPPLLPPAPAFPAPAAYGALPPTLAPLPPNAGAGEPFPFGAERVRLEAVVTGPHPYALVEDAGTTRLVTPGDELAGQTIAAITAGGIRLAHGRTIDIAPAAPHSRSVPGGRSR